MNKIIVFGSISTDFVVTTSKRPAVGETITGTNFETTFGGKGANQAVASARLGAEVHMIGTVGEDIFGKELIKNLKDNEINTNNVKPVPCKPSGSAHITIGDGDNSIIYIPGANNEIDIERIRSLEKFVRETRMIVVQNEMPQYIVNEIIEMCFENDVQVIFNPAPAREMDQAVLEKATYFTPNENEFHQLFEGLTISEGLAKYPNQLILTMGSKGVYFHDGEKEQRIPAYNVLSVDTTGAGDTFNGAFAVAISSGLDMAESIRFGNLAASLSIQKFGAQGGMPSLEEMKESEHYEKIWNIK